MVAHSVFVPRPVAVGRRLLIVQREPVSARALARFMRPYFSHVDIAASPSEADAILDAGGTETDVVCGERFGPEEQRGTRWLADLRARRSAIRRVVLTTSEVVDPRRPGVDAVFPKPFDPVELATYLTREPPR